MSGSKQLQRLENAFDGGPCYDVGNQSDVEIKAYIPMSIKIAVNNFRIRYIVVGKQGMSRFLLSDQYGTKNKT